MKKEINIIKSFGFGLRFIKNNLIFLIIPFILYSFIGIIGSYILQINIKGNFIYLNLYIISNITHFTINNYIPLPANGFFSFVPINYALLLILYTLVTFVGSYTYIFILNKVISWKNKIVKNIDNKTMNTISLSLVCKVFIGAILFGGIIYLCNLPTLFIYITSIFRINISSFLSLILFISKFLGIFASIYFFICFYFFTFLIVDKNVSIINAFKQSYAITKGQKLNLFFILTALRFLTNFPYMLFNKLIRLVTMNSLYVFLVSIITLSLYSAFISVFAIATYFNAYKQLSDNEEPSLIV